MAKPLTEELVADLRERHDYLRTVDQDSPEEERLTPAELDSKVAQEYSVSVSSVQNIVMGLSHTKAGGPIDLERRARRDLYLREREALGETEARRRIQLRARGLPIASTVTEVLALRLTVMNSQNKPTVASVTLAPGEWIKTELVAAELPERTTS